MKEAKISEIFLSLQGEGLYVGKEQLFVRFYGCNLSCVFCDTKPGSYKTLTRDALMSKILEYREPYHSISFTGGEPLLQADFIRDFLSEYKRFYNKLIYLETNGTLCKELSKIMDYVDIIAMDFKLPSSTERIAYWKEHRKFLKVASDKEVFIKAVVTSRTSPDDIGRMAKTVKKIGKDIPVVLQPVTAEESAERVSDENIARFGNAAKEYVSRVEIVPQVHKLMGIK